MRKEIRFKKDGFSKNDAAGFADAASKFKSDIQLFYNNKKVNAKSLLGLIAVSSSLKKDDEILLIADGPDDSKALSELSKLL